MMAFRALLVVMLIGLAGYTALVVAEHGMGLVPVFFGDIGEMGWPGQFNLDFAGFLVLSALWTAWRNQFSAAGLALALLAGTGGMLFLATYLLVLSFAAKGDMRTILMGPGRA